METYFNKSNMIKAGGVTIAVMLAQNLTAGKSKLVQGIASVAAAMVALPLTAKIGG
jgi:tRNA A37 threonylcarbamoyladenosine biosynthesis protein TsaE